jgi:hypothetical protein
MNNKQNQDLLHPAERGEGLLQIDRIGHEIVQAQHLNGKDCAPKK